MRFLHKQQSWKRVRTFFAWYPVDTNRETRWLETVTVEESFNPIVGWINIRFIDTQPTPPESKI